MEQRTHWLLQKYGDLVLLLLAMILTNLFFFFQRGWTMNPVYIAAVSFAGYLGLKYIRDRRERLGECRVRAGIAVLGLLFAAMNVVGNKIQPDGWEFQEFSFSDIPLFLFYFVIGCVVFSALYLLSRCCKIEHFLLGSRQEADAGGWNRKRNWLIYSGILIAAWLPIFFVYYPGIVPGDATVSISMVVGQQPWTNHFPVFYSLIIGAFLLVGYLLNNLNLGVALYSIAQLLIMAFGIGFFLTWLQEKRVKRWLIYLFLCYFTAAPLFGNYAIVMWKDPWFGGMLILLLMFLYDHVVEDRQSFLERKNLICYALLLVIMSLIRNNGIYIAVFISVVLLVIYRKHFRKVLAASAAGIAMILIITGPVYRGFFSAENVFVESVGIPLQQMARVVVTGGELTEEEREFLDQLLPIELYDDYYNPYLVDPIKWAPDFDMDFLEANKSEFFKTWWSILKRHFGTYVEQYLMGTYGFWHIGGELPYEFVKTDISENTWGLYQAEILYQYFDYDMKAALWEKYDYIASGLLIWILLYDVVLCWMRKKTVYILPLLVFVGNWMTLMIATPIAFGIRYVYVCVIGLPLLIVYGFMLSNGEGIPGEKKKQGVENVADAGVKGRGDL